MKAQLWHCPNITWWSGELRRSVDDCLVLFICFEKGDSSKTVDQAVRRIIQLNQKRFGEDKLIVLPFAHLSSKLAPLKEARVLQTELIQKIKADFDLVDELPFNKEKGMRVELAERNDDVSFFEY